MNITKRCSLLFTNNQYMLVIYLADDGEGYTGTTMHDYYPDDRHQAMLEKRILYLRDKFAEMKISSENIMIMLITSGFGRGMFLGIKKSLSAYKTIKFVLMELKCLSINEKNDFLPRYIRAKTKLHAYGFEAMDNQQYYHGIRHLKGKHPPMKQIL